MQCTWVEATKDTSEYRFVKVGVASVLERSPFARWTICRRRRTI